MKVFIADNFTGSIRTHTFPNVRFAYRPYSIYNWTVPLGLLEDEVINITNKKLSFFPIEMKNEDPEYKAAATELYNFIQENKAEDIVVEEPSYLFFDFEAATSTVHTIDYLTYALYHYCLETPSPTLVIPSTAHPVCKDFLKLLQRWFPIRYFTVEPNQVYLFKRFTCIRSYIHVHMEEVKEFFNKNLIEPILNKYSSLPAYNIVARIKKGGNNLQTPVTAFAKSEIFDTYCQQHNILDLETLESEELKIYYLNKAKYIYVSWGSIYYIYINYYLSSTYNKYISALFHKSVMSERRFLMKLNSRYIYDNSIGLYQQNIIPFCGSFENQLYNTFVFQGEVLENLEDLREVVEKSQLLNHFKE